MLADIVRFNRSAHRYLEASPTVTLRMMIDDLHLGPWFRDYYLAAMGAAIWSMPLARMMDFPAHTLVRFFANHGLLAVRGHPQWYTVKGGSRTYVDRLTASFQGRIVTGCGVRRIRRVADGVTVWDDQGREHRFDRVVMAAHGDETLAMMDDADNDERRIFGAFKFSRNQVVVHDDVTLMPRARQAWASWVYTSESLRDQGEVVSLTYWMNNLQPLATTRPILITLNPGRAIAAQHIIDRHEFTHPIFDAGAIAAQGQLSVIQGRGGVYYAGAYWRYGFHEDGILSAVNVAVEMGITPPWM
jgi:predicted NAD/FAD-binding protein